MTIKNTNQANHALIKIVGNNPIDFDGLRASVIETLDKLNRLASCGERAKVLLSIYRDELATIDRIYGSGHCTVASQSLVALAVGCTNIHLGSL